VTGLGHLDAVTRQRISGWAWNPDRPDAPETILVTVDDEVIARVLANRYRVDLEQAGIGNGRFSFDLLPGQGCITPLLRTVIAVRRERDGTHLLGSPITIEPAAAFNAEVKQSIATLLLAAASNRDIEQRLAFLAQQTDALLALRADHDSGRHAREARKRLDLTRPTADTAPPDMPRRALVVDETVPVVKRDAGSNAILSHMQSLQRAGYEVSFAPADGNDDATAALKNAGIRCCSRPWYGSVEDVLVRQRGTFDLVYLHRAGVAANYAALVRHLQPTARLVYSVADLHFLRLARQAVIEDRPELKRRSRSLQRIEFMAAWYADAVVTHSQAEAALLARLIPAEKLHVVPWVVLPRPTSVPFKQRRGVAFIGNYAHKPNVDAARWLIEEIVPALARLGSDLPCLLVGSSLPASLRDLAQGQVEIVGQVEDLSEVFGRVRVTVAPLSYGAGIKGKVLDSLAGGVPCVCTPIAAEGLDLPPVLRSLVASSAADIAARIIALHDDEVLNRTCSTAGLEYMAEFASEQAVDTRLHRAIGHAAR